MERPYHLQAYSPYIQFEQVPQTSAWTMMSSIYQQGVKNIEIAFCPTKHLPALEAAHCRWPQRVKYMVMGALLCIPLVQLITYIALRYFAKKIQVVDDNDDFELIDVKPALVIKKKGETPTPAPTQEIEEVEVEEIEKVPLQSIIEQNIETIFKELVNAKARRERKTIKNDAISYPFELQINDKGEIYTVKDADFFKADRTIRNVAHKKLYTFNLRFLASQKNTPDRAFQLVPQADQIIPSRLKEALEDFTTQLNDIPAKIMEKLPPMTINEQAKWLEEKLVKEKNDLVGWRIILAREPLWSVILRHWDELQYLFVKKNRKFEEEAGVEKNPEEIEGVVAVEEDKEQYAQIIEQNMEFLIEDFPNAIARRVQSSFVLGGPNWYLYEFQLQMNEKGEIYRMQEYFFKESTRTKEVEHSTLYNIDFTFDFRSFIPLDRAFWYTITSPANLLPPHLIHTADELVTQFKNITERIMQELSSKTTDEQTDWLEANLQNGIYAAVSYKDMLQRQTLWSIILHHWDQLHHLFVKKNKKLEEAAGVEKNPEEVGAPANKQKAQEVEGVVAVEEDKEQYAQIVEKNFQSLIEAMPAYKMARDIQRISINDYIYHLQLEMNDKGEIYRIISGENEAELIKKTEVDHSTALYTIDTRIWLAHPISPDKVFKLRTPFEQLDDPKSSHLIQKMLEDLASQFTNIVAKIQQELSSKTIDEQLNWLAHHLPLEAQKDDQLELWKAHCQYTDISYFIFLSWDKLQHLFVEQNA